MVNYVFSMPFCPKCEIAKEAVMNLNRKLSAKDKIEIINIHSTDPRVKLLRKRFGGRIVDLPVFVISKQLVKRVFNSRVPGTRKYLVDSVLGVDYTKIFIKELIDNKHGG